VSRSNRLPLVVISAATFLLVAFWLVKRPIDDLPNGQIGFLLLVGAGCMLLYLASHLLRAVRLAIIGVSVHNTSFRTIALLNFSIAPWSLILPFKVDELIRVNELRSLNGSLARAVVTVVIDRSMDGPILLAFAFYFFAHDKPEIAMFTGFFGVMLAAVTIGFFAASQILQSVQRYIFVHHYKPRAVHMLRIIDHLRTLSMLGQETIANAAPILILCTLGIWCLEIAAVGLLLWASSSDHLNLQSVISSTLIRANSGWRAMLLGENVGFPAGLITRIFMTGLLLVWPAAISLYWRRRMSEIKDARFLKRRWSADAFKRRA
jgi:lysylphosphatidylglycerol synthase-like protein